LNINKNVNIPVVLFEELSVKKLLLVFEEGNEIVFIIKYDGKFVGGITQGDFKRALKNGIINVLEIINTKMHYIIMDDRTNESYARNEAEKIFIKYTSINNIPVVDKEAKLCFQYEREKNSKENKIKNCINMVDDNLVFEAFFKCYKTGTIIITGASQEILNQVKKLFENKCKQILKEKSKNINIFIRSLSECNLLGQESIVISITYFGKAYLELDSVHCKAKIIPLESLISYRDYNQIYKFSQKSLLTWIELFGYEKMIISEYNPYTFYIKSMLEKCKLDVKFLQDNNFKELEIKNDETEIFLSSGNGKYLEEMSLGRFIRIVNLIEDYYNISGSPLLASNCVNAFSNILKSIEKQGIKILYYKVYNNLDLQLQLTLNGNIKVKILDSSKVSLYNAGGGIKDSRNNIYGTKVQAIDFIVECIQYSIDNLVYHKLKKLCKNVYKFNIRKLKYENTCCNLIQNRMNYAREEKNMFPENFVEDIYEDNNYPIQDLLNDILGCKVIEVSKYYIKYQSNYSSVYFNTDIYGNRITTDIPENYNNSIFLLGNCMMSGYAVSDSETLASHLQRNLNQRKLSYRVVNLGIDSGYSQYIYQKIGEYNILDDDIIIMIFPWTDSNDLYTLSVDYEKIFSASKGKRFYWDFITHCNSKAYKLIADDILEKIKLKINIKPEKIIFKLDSNMENEIGEYIDKVKREVRRCYKYKNICTTDSVKSGAIVMNCNPFTYGHKYLIETASRHVDILYIFVVEENKFIFSFEERFKMVQSGVENFSNVIVIPAGRFMISTLTFPGYFIKESSTKKYYDSFLDLKIFAKYIAPGFGISVRFVGTEPSDEVTAQYNRDMHIILNSSGINVIEIPRKKINDEVISASFVRQFMKNGEWEKIRKIVPETTYMVLKNKL